VRDESGYRLENTLIDGDAGSAGVLPGVLPGVLQCSLDRLQAGPHQQPPADANQGPAWVLIADR
jgi:hypothetical protein